MNNKAKDQGTAFEDRFYKEASDAGYYIQQMPARVGFDFILDTGSGVEIVEAKCIQDAKLKLRHFTPIEIRVAEEMTEKGTDYIIVFPLYHTIGRISWRTIRGELLNGRYVMLDDPFSKRALPELKQNII